MIKNILFFVLLMISKYSYCQMNLSPTVELKDVLFNENNLKGLIKKDFIPYNISYDQAINHTIGIYKFNLILRDPKKSYTLMDIPIFNMYCYSKNSHEFCIYLLMKITSTEQTNSLIKLFGWPWNVLPEDYISSDFDMLIWDKHGYDISLIRHFEKNLKLLRITNIPGQELYHQL